MRVYVCCRCGCEVRRNSELTRKDQARVHCRPCNSARAAEGMIRRWADGRINARPKDNHAEKNPRWNGGRHVDRQGYVHVWAPEHPAAVRNKVREHRLVMEDTIGRYLEPGEVVHHINGAPSDNRPENLRLHSRNGEHHAKDHPELAGNLPQPISATCVTCGAEFRTRAWSPLDTCPRCRRREQDRKRRPARYRDLS
jgi:hypothetical protein